MNFSRRIGLEPATKALQKDSMEWQLRNSLWNVFDMVILADLRQAWDVGGPFVFSRNPPNAVLFVRLWMYFYKWNLSDLPEYAVGAADIVRRWFFDKKAVPWNRVYDFVECVGNLDGNMKDNSEMFRVLCNDVLEREFSAYRFVNGTLTPITNEAEIKAIEQAASLDTSQLRPVSLHIDTALKLLADRNKPDYRNSMKESISAVEAICKIIVQDDKTTLGKALDVMKTRMPLHAKLHEAFKALYSYTNDTHGIRHALKDDEEPEAEDAMFMLVSCSAFVNYLVEKARKHNLLPK